MLILGIDPGKKGAFSCFDTEVREIVLESPIPILSNGDYDITEILKFAYIKKWDHVFMEDVHSIFGSSAKSNFQFGRGVGILEAVITSTSRPFTLVKPKEWQKTAWQGIKLVKNPKANSLAAAKRLFPNNSFLATQRSKVPHEGLIDAALIAYYGSTKIK